jgi:adenylosuccinate synthase
MVRRSRRQHNAGHALVIDGVTTNLSLLPSGVVRPGKLAIIGVRMAWTPGWSPRSRHLKATQGVSISAES